MNRFLTLIVLSGLSANLSVANSLTFGGPHPTTRQGEDNITLPPLCTNPPKGTCDFYSVCLESQYHCGPDGYPLKYGVYYCEKFIQDRAELSREGQSWIFNTMECLQHALIPEAISTIGVTCTSLEDAAFASHAKCYIDSGLCALPPTDWLAIVSIISVVTIFGNKQIFLSALETEAGCLEAYLFFAAHLL